MMEKKDLLQGPGSEGFKKSYWKRYYSNPDVMDCTYNAYEHALYLKHLFALEFVEVTSLVELGFGFGDLLKAMLEVFNPYYVEGIEPSGHAFAIAREKELKPVESTELRLEHLDLLTWCQDRERDDMVFDLGICTSVFQYLSDEEIRYCMPILAKRMKYLYFTVPIDIELKYQEDEMDFNDVYAKHRSREEYHEFFRGNFTVVGTRVLESNVHFREMTSPFHELLYRY